MSMIHIRHTFSALLFLTAAASMMSCSDKLFEENNTPVDNKDIAFTVQTNESSELTNVTPETRAAIAVQTGERPYLLSLKDGEQEIPLRASTVRYMEMDQRRGTVDIEAANVEGGTRTTPKTTATFYSDFGVSAYRYASTWAETLTPNHMYNVKMTNSSGIYRNDANSSFWPASGKLRFFAYAPYADATYLKMNSASTATGFPTLSYTVPTTVTAQKDVMVADQEVTCSGTHAAQPLAFDHALTAVNFAVGNLKKGTIKKITISGVYGAGTYSYKTKSWTTTGSANASYSVSPNYTTANRSLSSNVFITSGDNTLLLIPQTLPTSATVSVEFLFDGEATTRTLTAKLSSDGKAVWAKGTTVTYTVSTKSINEVLIATGPAPFTYKGGDNSFTVQSYRWVGDGGQQAIPWTAKVLDEKGNEMTNSWISVGVSEGSAVTQTKQVHCSAQTGSQTSHDEVLFAGSVKGASADASRYDLSTHDQFGNSDAMNTANCYVINSKGYYKLPLVYGNAIKNGADNQSAYVSSVSSSSVTYLKRFVDHKDQPIMHPEIYKCYSPTNSWSAKVVWQDTALVSNVHLDAAKHYLCFDIVNKITEGNAVVAVTDGTNIMWSWHIWVSSEDVYTTKRLVNHEGKSFEVMPVLLGWCNMDNYVYRYPPRYAFVQINQTGTGLTDNFQISQENYYGNSSSVYGNSPLWQWGRKDPMLPPSSNHAGATDKHLASGSQTWEAKNLGGDIGMSIKNPFTFDTNWANYSTYAHTTGVSSLNSCSFNLWSTNNVSTNYDDDIEVVKTIYDPCPKGFKIPNRYAFTGFTTDGQNQPIVNESTVNYQSINNGITLYCNNNDRANGGTIYLPCAGERLGANGRLGAYMLHIWYSQPSQYNETASYLSYVSISSNGTYTIYDFDPNSDTYPTGFWRSYGWSILCQKE